MLTFLSIMAALAGGAVAKSIWLRSRPASVAEREQRRIDREFGEKYLPMSGEPVRVVIE